MTGLLEVKCPNMRMFQRYQREGLPAHMVIQGQHYLGVTGYEWMAFAIFNADLWKLVHFEIKRDEAFIAGLFEREKNFWQDYVEKRIPPPPVTIAMAPPEFELPPVEGQIVQRDDAEWSEAAENFKAARDLKESAEGLEAQAKQRVVELMGPHRVVEGANLRVYNLTMPGRAGFDDKALAKAKPLDRNGVAFILTDWIDGLRTKLDPTVLAEIAVGNLLLKIGAHAELDLKPFQKIGKPYSQVRPYFLKPDAGEEE